MMRKFYTKSFFQSMPSRMLTAWLTIHKKQLIGSSVFTVNNSLLSKAVSWASNWGKDKKDFIPSHVGSIIEKDNNLYVFNMAPPNASMSPLGNYLLHTDNDYRLVIRDFDIDTRWFSSDIIFHLGEFYPYLSALRSVFTKRPTKFVNHCSELHCRCLQKQGLFTGFNPECTPLELYELLIGEDKNK